MVVPKGNGCLDQGLRLPYTKSSGACPGLVLPISIFHSDLEKKFVPRNFTLSAMDTEQVDR